MQELGDDDADSCHADHGGIAYKPIFSMHANHHTGAGNPNDTVLTGDVYRLLVVLLQECYLMVKQLRLGYFQTLS
jgi:hypothetical protein